MRLFSMLRLAFCMALLTALFGLPGCKTTPTANQQLGLAVLVDAAVGIAVQNGSQDPAVWAERAAKVLSIAKQLQAIDQGEVATLPALTAALGPLIDQAKLAPAERLAANALITALAQVIQQNANNASLPTQAAIQIVLADVIMAASVYVPST